MASNSSKVLVVEDNPKVSRFLLRVLSDEGLVADSCENGDDAVAQTKNGVYDLVILDWMLPNKDGLSVCRELRRAGNNVPILMLTARGEVRERVLGLESGADDYLVKPFEVEELVERIHALLRRTRSSRRVSVGDLEIDLEKRSLVIEGSPVSLTGRELDVLAAVVLGGARLGGGRGSVLGCLLGVLLVAVTQNGLNLLGVSPYAFKMVVGAIILIAISTSGVELVRARPRPGRA